jgi:putative ATP-binding cassette transporter
LRDIEIHDPNGKTLLHGLNLRLEPGESLVITGKSGCGRTTLLRSIARLWPYATGTIRRPDGDTDAMFLSQVPYLPLGDLRAVLSYPDRECTIADDDLVAALDSVALGHLANRLNEIQDWSKVLSPGEQQRIAFARVLLQKPGLIFLEESTSAIDEGQEFAIYRMLDEPLPDSIIVSVTHRATVEQHHDHHLRLLGDGTWTLDRRPERIGSKRT